MSHNLARIRDEAYARYVVAHNKAREYERAMGHANTDRAYHDLYIRYVAAAQESDRAYDVYILANKVANS